jgi:hypothetical protein
MEFHMIIDGGSHDPPSTVADRSIFAIAWSTHEEVFALAKISQLTYSTYSKLTKLTQLTQLAMRPC